MKFHQLTERGPHPLVVSKSYLDAMFAEDQSVLLLDWNIRFLFLQLEPTPSSSVWTNTYFVISICMLLSTWILTITVLLKYFLKAISFKHTPALQVIYYVSFAYLE